MEASTSAPAPPPVLNKRGRHSDESGGSDEWSLPVPKRQFLRPGIPAETPSSSWGVLNRDSPPPRPDDADGHYVFQLGENLSSRYKILSKMGEGTFGRVLECWDRKHRDYVAIKIVRAIDKYRSAAMIELEVLNTLERNDPTGHNHCVALREWFDYRGHVCMVFEKLGPSLWDFLRKNKYRPFPIDVVQDFARQLVESVAYMHELHLVHTDLKPENILLKSLEPPRSPSVSTISGQVPSSSAIKVIDFGSATFEEQYHSSIVSTRHYRAPEVILGLGWSYPCDMWSVGCIIVELITGDALFQTHENLEHLAMMEAVLGPVSESMSQRALRAQPALCSKFFNAAKGGRLAWPEGAANKKSVRAVKKMQKLRSIVTSHGDVTAQPYVDLLCDLLSRLLRYEPHERLTASQALAHPFFHLQLAPTPGVAHSNAVLTSALTAVATAATAVAPELQLAQAQPSTSSQMALMQQPMSSSDPETVQQVQQLVHQPYPLLLVAPLMSNGMGIPPQAGTVTLVAGMPCLPLVVGAHTVAAFS